MLADTGIQMSNTRSTARGIHSRFVRIILTLAATLLLFVAQSVETAHSQDQPGTYIVAPGDTLAEIAVALGVPLEILVQVNQIADPSYIQVGQVLIVPNPDGTLPVAAIQTGTLAARPGESLGQMADRFRVKKSMLAQINGLDSNTRLFPGQTVKMPVDAIVEQGVRFGAVIDAELPKAVTQGRTTWFEIITDRPTELDVSWNDLPVPLTPVGSNPLRQFGFVPAPALIQPGIYPLTVAYSTRRGIRVSRTWPVVIGPGAYATESIVLSDEVNDLLEPQTVSDELALVAGIWSQATPDLRMQGIFQRPIGEEFETTSPFGTRRAYGGGPVNGYHSGQDFSAPAGVAVVAPAPARVAMALPINVRGNAILLDHGRGLYTGYWHLSELRVSEGQEVNAGDIIGLVGTTGLSTGNHLHWEMRIYGVAVDPMQFLETDMTPE